MSTTLHHHNDIKWKSEIKQLAEDNAKLLHLVRSVTATKTHELSKKDEEIESLKSELKSCKIKLGVTEEELKVFRSGGNNNNNSSSGGGAGGGEAMDSLRAELLELKDKLEDSANFTQNLQAENSRFKMQVKTAQQKARSAEEEALTWKRQVEEMETELEETRSQLRQQEQSLTSTMNQLKQQVEEHQKLQQQEQEKHADPNENNNNNNSSNLEKELEELRSQRDYYMSEAERLNSRDSRDQSELQQWSTLLKKLVSSLRQVKSKWDVETEGSSENMKTLADALSINVSPEDSYAIIDNLSRVSAQVKKSSNQTTQLLSSTVSHQSNLELDNFTQQLRPAVVDVLKLVHGIFADAAYLWAMVKKYKQLEQEWNRKEQELSTKKKGFLFVFSTTTT